MTQLSNIADKFAMKLGLETRPGFSMTMDEVETGDIDADEPQTEEDITESLKYLDKGPNSDLAGYLHYIRNSMHDLSTQLDLSDFHAAIETINNAMHDLHKLKEVIKTKRDTNQADTYMYDPVEAEPDEDFERYWSEYLDELGAMDWNELWSERKKLEDEVNELLADEQEPSFVLTKRLKEVKKRLSKIK